MSLVLRLLSAALPLFTVLPSVIAPLTSFIVYSNSVDGRVYIVVTEALTSHLRGYSFGGIMIAMKPPGDYKSYPYNFEDVVGKRLDLDFRELARDWAEFYRCDIGRILESSPSLPTISITITLYKEGRGV